VLRRHAHDGHIIGDFTTTLTLARPDSGAHAASMQGRRAFVDTVLTRWRRREGLLVKRRQVIDLAALWLRCPTTTGNHLGKSMSELPRPFRFGGVSATGRTAPTSQP
jgi:hypothetical protein